MLMFFNSHICNSLCEKFELINLRESGYIPQMNKEDQKINKTFDICIEYFIMSTVDYIKSRKERKEMCC